MVGACSKLLLDVVDTRTPKSLRCAWIEVQERGYHGGGMLQAIARCRAY
jgi:hypothetical protein